VSEDTEPRHLASPMSFDAKGIAATVVQDSQEDRSARVLNCVLCEEGFRQDLPEYGVPSLFGQIVPLQLAPFQAAIERWTDVEVSTEELENLIPADRIVKVDVP